MGPRCRAGRSGGTGGPPNTAHIRDHSSRPSGRGVARAAQRLCTAGYQPFQHRHETAAAGAVIGWHRAGHHPRLHLGCPVPDQDYAEGPRSAGSWPHYRPHAAGACGHCTRGHRYRSYGPGRLGPRGWRAGGRQDRGCARDGTAGHRGRPARTFLVRRRLGCPESWHAPSGTRPAAPARRRSRAVAGRQRRPPGDRRPGCRTRRCLHRAVAVNHRGCQPPAAELAGGRLHPHLGPTTLPPAARPLSRRAGTGG